jgi:hypothetical protein
MRNLLIISSRRRWISPVCIALLASLLASGVRAGQTRPDPCAESNESPDDINLELSVKDRQTLFREGEIIELELSLTSSSPKKYQANTRNYDRSGRLNAQVLCLDPPARDPLSDYFDSGLFGFMGGGLGGSQIVGQTAFKTTMELNEWKALSPGTYRLRVQDNRISLLAPTDSPGPFGAGVPVWSNSIYFKVIAADAEWQAQQLADAVQALDTGSNDAAKHAARVLRFLGSEAATRELARRFWALNDEPYGWDLMFGLIGSQYRTTAIESMKAAAVDPQHPVTREFMQTLALLEIQSNPEYQLPQFDEKRKDEWQEQLKKKTAAYNKLITENLDELTKKIESKTGEARAVSASTLLQEIPRNDPTTKAQLRRLLTQSWDLLPENTRKDLIEYRWDQIGGPEMLPVLRQIVNSQPAADHHNGDSERGPALRRIYDISPTEGRTLILSEILNGQSAVGMSVLGILPDKNLPELDQPLLARINGSRNPSDISFQLVDRYATKDVLRDLKTVYEKNRGEWPCIPQSALLRYFLRVEPEYGVAQVADALVTRQHTGCYKMLFGELGDAVRSPTMEKLALASLNDDSPEVVANAANALARYGSAAAEGALWKRFQVFEATWKGKEDQFQYRPGIDPTLAAQGTAENALFHAITNAQGWVCGAEDLKRLEQIVDKGKLGEVRGLLAEWDGDEIMMNLNWWPEGKLSYTVGHYSGQDLGMDGLKEKLGQFPARTRFRLILNPDEHERHKNEIAEIERIAATRSLVIDIVTPDQN